MKDVGGASKQITNGQLQTPSECDRLDVEVALVGGLDSRRPDYAEDASSNLELHKTSKQGRRDFLNADGPKMPNGKCGTLKSYRRRARFHG